MEKELEYLEVFRSGNVDGVILVATILSAAHKQALGALGCPAVLVGQRMEGMSCVYHDDEGAARAVTELLAAKRPAAHRLHRRHPARQGGGRGAARRLAGGHARGRAGAQHGVDGAERFLDRRRLRGGRAAACARAGYGGHPSGATDSIAIGAKKWLEEHGRHIPTDIALAGIGHSRLSELVRPRLATAHYYYQSSGEEAARDLLEIIEQGIDRKKQLMLGFAVHRGESV